jgi:hypothetical protein
VRLTDLRRDKAYLILHVYIIKVTGRILLILEDEIRTEKDVFAVVLPILHRDAIKPFSNLTISNINSQKWYYKFRHIGECVCPVQSLFFELIPLSRRGFVSDLGGTF